MHSYFMSNPERSLIRFDPNHTPNMCIARIPLPKAQERGRAIADISAVGNFRDPNGDGSIGCAY
jgi:hypothetical protein